ncbi:glutathione S-transferase [Iodidimonas gelatinilytica]|uniref:glutathione transferase n=1 Tax=Iodidimonas gelatinilytica TaxID=1236966 RepID=A0A5A7MMH6_9PROT|nr:glutathione S-transferase family protein [Iodidimonas gelatinilytica]GEQ96854.1 glutathione S-transferase [Iodidimonas gelatinilytica]
MITLHHLSDSRSQRILWLLEELGVPYEVVRYERDAQTRFAPIELAAIHPLGKSPVIVDNGTVIAESGAIVDYLAQLYGKGVLTPPQNSAAYWEHQQWMHFAEGSAMLPFLLGLYCGKLGEAVAPLQPRIAGEMDKMLGYLNQALEGKDWIMGDRLSAADFMLSFIGEIAASSTGLGSYPHIAAYLKRIHARPAFKRALKAGGPYIFAASSTDA